MIKRLSPDDQDKLVILAQSEGFNLNIEMFEQILGGSCLDDLREIIGFDSIKYKEDILIKLINDSTVDYSEHNLPPGKTYIARCTVRDNIPNYILCVEPEYKEHLSWEELK